MEEAEDRTVRSSEDDVGVIRGPDIRFDVWTNAGAWPQDHLWPIAHHQAVIEAYRWKRLLRMQHWTVELRGSVFGGDQPWTQQIAPGA